MKSLAKLPLLSVEERIKGSCTPARDIHLYAAGKLPADRLATIQEINLGFERLEGSAVRQLL